ncbi:hypothetical protein CKO25_14095 [Thiocapsa imhoffii]|uniref:Erythromycin esterase family protein n=1 Tax=Thiocapsa imhoffii TaxID=382777 RepID=A0A9X0WJ85_9GAMM|nr:erythromycin esterase family protein [Thiocapsa imhoffii]MBK1645762.1 hypothetical protein [Thiocapsa imhoffii]
MGARRASQPAEDHPIALPITDQRARRPAQAPKGSTRRRLGWLVGSGLWVAAGFALPACASENSEASRGFEDARVAELRATARPLKEASDLDPLIEAARTRRLVLLGESTHGTAEFYRWRDLLTRRLIEEAGFQFVAVEGDWASIELLNRYVKGLPGAPADARTAMLTFERWPTWMWANEEMRALVEWMRAYNDARPLAQRVGLYGIDVYGDAQARQTVVRLLRILDPELALVVSERYACLDRYGEDPIDYARAVARGQPDCEEAVAAVVELITQQPSPWEGQDPRLAFQLVQAARVVQGAERHYRKMTRPGPASWNARVDHFFDTLIHVSDYFGPQSRGIVWAHNTHIGDARATTMARQGQRNIGQLTREHHGAEDIYAVGFGTYRGTVLAGREWGAPGEVMSIPAAAPGSFEDLLERTGLTDLLLLLDDSALQEPLRERLDHRAIGVVFDPEHERTRNYVPTRMTERYDAFIHLARTRALEPLQETGVD